MAAPDHEQHTAEAQVDEADEDLHRLWAAGSGSARQAGPPPHRPLPAAEDANGQRLGNNPRFPSFERHRYNHQKKTVLRRKASVPQPAGPTLLFPRLYEFASCSVL